ncbi:Uncharacterised protein [Klebsiella michiganensis]|uniref:Uncharacterized protein n=1 Tax=Klebsiella michiganensis TaxID=1134687 RepID=A0A7H4PDS5_9ENTR|nr:Uncharacterised protein [Klebsiella michiganensis]
MFLDVPSLSRAGGRDNRFTVIVCKSSQNNETGFGSGGENAKSPRPTGLKRWALLSADDAILALLLGFIQRFINAYDKLLQGLHIPFPQSRAEGDR